jgi:hypothetical protein
MEASGDVVGLAPATSSAQADTQEVNVPLEHLAEFSGCVNHKSFGLPRPWYFFEGKLEWVLCICSVSRQMSGVL